MLNLECQIVCIPYFSSPVKECTGSNSVITRFQKRISGPMLDRIDIQRADYAKLSDDRLGELSSNVQVRVEAARERQRIRFDETDLACNADMRPTKVRDYCQLDETSNSLMRTAMNQMQLSARAYHRALKLERW